LVELYARQANDPTQMNSIDGCGGQGMVDAGQAPLVAVVGVQATQQRQVIQSEFELLECSGVECSSFNPPSGQILPFI
jgi:hypothetical protein